MKLDETVRDIFETMPDRFEAVESAPDFKALLGFEIGANPHNVCVIVTPGLGGRLAVQESDHAPADPTRPGSFEELVIARLNGIPIEETSWGRVKSQY